MRTTLALLVAILVVLVAAPSSQAAQRRGAGTDPNEAGVLDTQDVVAFAAVGDDAGAASMAIKLAAPPTSNALVVGRLGTRNGSTCEAPLVLFGGFPVPRVASYSRDGGTPTTAQISVSGAAGDTVTMSATDPGKLNVPFNCAQASVYDSTGTVLIDDTTPVDLVADPPPAPPPPPAPAPPPPVTPAPTTATAPPVPVAKAAKLTVSLDGAPTLVRRNRSISLKLRVANDGSKSTGAITLAKPSARGLSVTRLAARLAKLKPGKAKTVALRVRLTKRARTSTVVRVTVRSGKLKASSTLLLRLGRAKTAKSPTEKPKQPANPLVGTYWWRTVNHVDYAWDNRALFFVDGATVYSGFPKGGLPATCPTPPAKPEEEFDKRDGCLAYTYDAKTGTVTIGDKTGTFKDGKLTLDENGYYATQIPAAGARLNFKDHEHTDFFGLCGVFSTCSITKKFLTLAADGQFALSSGTTVSGGNPGGDFFAAGSYPPDERGTYEIVAGGRIRLAFADGSVREETFAIDSNHDTGVPDPIGEGVLLGEDNFYPDPAP